MPIKTSSLIRICMILICSGEFENSVKYLHQWKSSCMEFCFDWKTNAGMTLHDRSQKPFLTAAKNALTSANIWLLSVMGNVLLAFRPTSNNTAVVVGIYEFRLPSALMGKGTHTIFSLRMLLCVTIEPHMEALKLTATAGGWKNMRLFNLTCQQNAGSAFSVMPCRQTSAVQ